MNTAKEKLAGVRRLPMWKKLLFGVSPVVILLAAFESILILVGFSYRVEDAIPIEPVFTENETGEMMLNHRFPFQQYGTTIHNDAFPRQPSPDRLRIAMIGGSSVFNLGEFYDLDAEMERLLGQPVEVINFGANAMGTGYVLRAAREAVALKADVLMVYSGHNDFDQVEIDLSVQNFLHGPEANDAEQFAHLGTSGMMPLYGLRGLRTVQLLWKFQRSQIDVNMLDPANLSGGSAYSLARAWTVAEKEQIYRKFEYNLGQVAQLAESNHRLLVMGTVAANIANIPKFYEGEFNSDGGSQNSGALNFSEVRKRADSLNATALDCWKWGMCLLATKDNPQAAREYFERAILLNPHPFKADATINSIIRRVSKQNDIPLADVQSAINAAAAPNIPREQLFDDHCHLNKAGNDILLKTFAEVIRQHLEQP